MSVRFVPAGDLAVLVEFEEQISVETNARVRALEMLLERERIPGIVETVPSFRSLLVFYDPLTVSSSKLRASITGLLPEADKAEMPPSRRLELPCCYDDPELGFELAGAAERLGLERAELVRIHSELEYLVYFLGFAPGQPYMTGMPEELSIPRLETPRTKTPVGSVGIGGIQGCIYSVESPGGFWVLGRTPVRMYDPGAPDPILLQPGDRIRFRAIDRGEYDHIAAAVESRTYKPRIT
jgi:inhibitor of KinA